MKYKNCGRVTKTFFGQEFKPGEIHDVPGDIRDLKFFRVCGEPSSPEKPSPAVPQKRKYNKRQSKPNIKETPNSVSEIAIDEDNNNETASEESE